PAHTRMHSGSSGEIIPHPILSRNTSPAARYPGSHDAASLKNCRSPVSTASVVLLHAVAVPASPRALTAAKKRRRRMLPHSPRWVDVTTKHLCRVHDILISSLRLQGGFA